MTVDFFQIRYSDCLVRLPLYHSLSDADVDYIVKMFNWLFLNFKTLLELICQKHSSIEKLHTMFQQKCLENGTVFAPR